MPEGRDPSGTRPDADVANIIVPPRDSPSLPPAPSGGSAYDDASRPGPEGTPPRDIGGPRSRDANDAKETHVHHVQ